jgi:hypothetical protein
MNPRQLGAGVPGSFPLPISGQQGAAYTANAKMHPAALGAQARTNPLNARPPAMAGKK